MGSFSVCYGGGDTIVISFIVCRNPGNGYFSALVKAIERDGFKVRVPTPLGRMTAILERWGFRPSTIFDTYMGEEVEVWMRPQGVA